MNGSMVYLHEDFANDDVIIILEDSAEYDSDAVLHCVNVPITRRYDSDAVLHCINIPVTTYFHIFLANILFF